MALSYYLHNSFLELAVEKNLENLIIPQSVDPFSLSLPYKILTAQEAAC